MCAIHDHEGCTQLAQPAPQSDGLEAPLPLKKGYRNALSRQVIGNFRRRCDDVRPEAVASETSRDLHEADPRATPALCRSVQRHRIIHRATSA